MVCLYTAAIETLSFDELHPLGWLEFIKEKVAALTEETMQDLSHLQILYNIMKKLDVPSASKWALTHINWPNAIYRFTS